MRTIAGNESVQIIDWGEPNQPEVIQVGRHSRLTYCFAFIAQPTIERNLTVELADGAEADIAGFFLGRGSDSVQIEICTNHTGVGTRASVKINGTLTDEATAKFKGLIKIPVTGRGTDAWLEERVLLLSPRAKTDSIPSLEIEANDVKASHALTTGQLDEEILFYLMSRGLPRPAAARMLVEGWLMSPLANLNASDKSEALRRLNQTLNSLQLT